MRGSIPFTNYELRIYSYDLFDLWGKTYCSVSSDLFSLLSYVLYSELIISILLLLTIKSTIGRAEIPVVIYQFACLHLLFQC